MSNIFFYQTEDTPPRSQSSRETCGEVHRDPPPWKEGDQLNGFTLVKLLGHGGSGFVYRAFDAATKRHIALKILRKSEPDVLLRNRLGFRRMMHVEHPNLLRVDRIYQLGSYTGLAMEEIRGVTLAKALAELKTLPQEQAFDKLLRWMRDFAAGLAMMHCQGYIHRDIKPENLMVDSEGRGQIIDYGLVDTFDVDEITIDSNGFFLGTPQYMAPEVIWSQRYLPAGDVFSLGIVMLEALNQVSAASHQPALPVTRDHACSVDCELIFDALENLSEVVPKLIRDACVQMLDRHPCERPTALRLARLGLPPKVVLPRIADEPLVGRDSELKELLSWADSVFAGAVSRLHLTGPSGSGKTRLLEELVKHVESKHWGQLFRGRCRVREDSALQAFEQICDGIAHRYMRSDREKLQLDPVSAEILSSVFPVLKNTIEAQLHLPPAAAPSSRLDALEAGARMCQQLRTLGPLFIVIDDAQWADQDSLSALDRLQSVIGEAGMGIVTVSPDPQDRQRVPANKIMALGPIDRPAAVRYLSETAARWGVPITPAAVAELADAAEGSPYRLREMANEFRPGGALAEIDQQGDPQRPLRELGSVDHLWQKRFERLSDEAKDVLLYVFTAGGGVSTEQLCQLTSMGDEIDAAVSELVRQGLVRDEASGGECISIYHDRVADHMVNKISGQARRQANHAWASLLVRQDNPERLAARIAGHWFAAGQPGRAVSYAVLAAEDAQRRVANAEAGRWHARVIDHVQGAEKVYRIRRAARCYREADVPVEAAKYYQMLAEHQEGEERIESQLFAAIMLIRSGQLSLFREQLRPLAKSLGLPTPKHPLLAKAALLINGIRFGCSGRSPMKLLTSQKRNVARSASVTGKRHQEIEVALALVRPLSMFDSLYSAELNLRASRLARRYGSFEQRVVVAVGEAVFACYDEGSKRVQATTDLLEMLQVAQDSGSHQAQADVWAGLAFSHALAGRWSHVSDAVASSIENYSRLQTSFGCEVPHARWLDLLATWNLGRWQAMMEVSDSMFEDALRR